MYKPREDNEGFLTTREIPLAPKAFLAQAFPAAAFALLASTVAAVVVTKWHVGNVCPIWVCRTQSVVFIVTVFVVFVWRHLNGWFTILELICSSFFFIPPHRTHITTWGPPNIVVDLNTSLPVNRIRFNPGFGAMSARDISSGTIIRDLGSSVSIGVSVVELRTRLTSLIFFLITVIPTARNA